MRFLDIDVPIRSMWKRGRMINMITLPLGNHIFIHSIGLRGQVTNVRSVLVRSGVEMRPLLKIEALV